MWSNPSETEHCVQWPREDVLETEQLSDMVWPVGLALRQPFSSQEENQPEKGREQLKEDLEEALKK